MQALPIQCVLTLWIQIVVMVHVYCVGSHMYTTDCDITFPVFQCTLLQSSPLRRIQHIFCRYSQSLHAQLRLFPFIRYQYGWVYRGSIGWKRQPAAALEHFYLWSVVGLVDIELHVLSDQPQFSFLWLWQYHDDSYVKGLTLLRQLCCAMICCDEILQV